MACAGLLPHISTEGRRSTHTAGRSGRPNRLQRKSASNCTQATPAGLPFGMPGMGELIDGAVQQAAQWERQFIEVARRLRVFTITGFPDPEPQE